MKTSSPPTSSAPRRVTPLGRATLTSALIAIVALLVTVPGPRAEAAPTEHKFMSLNFCGSNCQGGGFGKIPALVSAVAAYRPSVVMLSEVCQAQLDRIVAVSASTALPLKADYTQLSGSWDGCADGPSDNKSIGNAILIPRDTASFVAGTRTVERVYPPNGMQRVTCVDTTGALAYRTTVCNTHISPADRTDPSRDARIAAEIRVAVRVAEEAGAGKPLVLGGDFNRNPTLNAMNSVYHRGASGTGQPSAGRFEEVNQCAGANPRASGSGCNNGTHKPSGQKIDYIFFKQAYFRNQAGRVVTTDFGSDHHLIQGRATVCGTATC